jgi:ASC-1-like (ASCH) protein
MMGKEIKDLEARGAGPGYNNGVANIAVGDMVRFQAGNGPDNFGSEHILAEVMERRKHRHAGAMLKAEPLERLVGPGVTMPQALQIYCGVSTRRWTNLDISPSQDATHRAHATAMLGESPSALEKWLRERGIRPKKYRKEEMQQAMRTIAAQGVVGMLRDTASPRPDPTEWDKDFKASKDTYFIVWALAIRKIRIHGFTPNPSPPPTKTTPPTAPLRTHRPHQRMIPRKAETMMSAEERALKKRKLVDELISMDYDKSEDMDEEAPRPVDGQGGTLIYIACTTAPVGTNEEMISNLKTRIPKKCRDAAAITWGVHSAGDDSDQGSSHAYLAIDIAQEGGTDLYSRCMHGRLAHAEHQDGALTIQTGVKNGTRFTNPFKVPGVVVALIFCPGICEKTGQDSKAKEDEAVRKTIPVLASEPIRVQMVLALPYGAPDTYFIV